MATYTRFAKPGERIGESRTEVAKRVAKESGGIITSSQLRQAYQEAGLVTTTAPSTRVLITDKAQLPVSEAFAKKAEEAQMELEAKRAEQERQQTLQTFKEQQLTIGRAERKPVEERLFEKSAELRKKYLADPTVAEPKTFLQKATVSILSGEFPTLLAGATVRYAKEKAQTITPSGINILRQTPTEKAIIAGVAATGYAALQAGGRMVKQPSTIPYYALAAGELAIADVFLARPLFASATAKGLTGAAAPRTIGGVVTREEIPIISQMAKRTKMVVTKVPREAELQEAILAGEGKAAGLRRVPIIQQERYYIRPPKIKSALIAKGTAQQQLFQDEALFFSRGELQRTFGVPKEKLTKVGKIPKSYFSEVLPAPMETLQPLPKITATKAAAGRFGKEFLEIFQPGRTADNVVLQRLFKGKLVGAYAVKPGSKTTFPFLQTGIPIPQTEVLPPQITNLVTARKAVTIGLQQSEFFPYIVPPGLFRRTQQEQISAPGAKAIEKIKFDFLSISKPALKTQPSLRQQPAIKTEVALKMMPVLALAPAVRMEQLTKQRTIFPPVSLSSKMIDELIVPPMFFKFKFPGRTPQPSRYRPLFGRYTPSLRGTAAMIKAPKKKPKLFTGVELRGLTPIQFKALARIGGF